MPRRWQMTMRPWVRHRWVLHILSWLFCSSFIVWFRMWSLLHIWFVRRARGIQHRFRSRLRIRGSRWWFLVGIGHRQWCVPSRFIPFSSSSLWWPASRRCRGLPRRPFHVGNSFCRPAPVLGQSPERSRAEKPHLCSQRCVRRCASPCPTNIRTQTVSSFSASVLRAVVPKPTLQTVTQVVRMF